MPPTAKQADWVGLTLSRGRYEIKSKLGEGGMGCVYRARDRKLDSDVIIKVPRPALLLDPEFVARFTHEVRALVRLEHPNIVRVMDVDKHAEAPFAVMQFLGGGSLEDRQTKQPDGTYRPLPVDQLRSWLPQVAAALDFVHQQGYVHRDVKPANILFDQRGHVYLSDFGVAKAVAEAGAGPAASLTGTGVVLGTPAYMAPEMALGKKYDGRIDQYALAVTVYELLAGRWPFEGPTPSAILLKQTSEAPPRLDKLNPRISSAVADVVQQALAKDPAKRFASCAVFAQAVIRASQGRVNPPTTGKSPTVATQPLAFDPPVRRHQRSLAPLLVLGLLGLILVGGLTAGLIIRQMLLGAPPSQVARLSLSPDAVLLTPGTDYKVEVRIERAGFTGPVEVEVLNLPPRVNYSLPRIASDWSTGTLELVTDPEARPKEQTATIRARMGDAVLEQPLRVTVRELLSTLPAKDSSQVSKSKVSGPSQPNSIGMRFMTLPAGEYARGSPEDDPNAEADERPQQLVRLTKPFEMAVNEVTVGQFRKFVDATGYRTEAESSGKGSDGYDPSMSTYIQDYLPKFNWRNVGWAQSEDHPVVSVTWADAMAFCKWLSDKEGRTYRLPSEAEWEYAARAGTTTRFWTGDTAESLKGAENIADASLRRRWSDAETTHPWDDGHPFSAPVGSFKPNPWGLYDMLGNVGEKAADRYDPNPHRQASSTDPTGPGPGGGNCHTLRSGGWIADAPACRAASRWGESEPDYRDAASGFRVVREVLASSNAPAHKRDDKRTEEPNSLSMPFVKIPAGEYVRGSPADDPDADQNERPQQRVRLTRPFEMAIHEVTVGQFRKFVEATGYQTEAESSGEGSDGFDTSTSEFVQGPLPRFNWRNVGWTQTDNHPVVSTSYNDARAFCTWLSQKEGRTYRLPTEAEWEYAARAGTTTRYWTGDSVASLEGAENFADVSLQKRWPKAMYGATWDDGNPFTAPVGSFRSNPWGLFDMLGNAAERVSDFYDPDSYKQPSVTDPIGAKTGPPIFRGVSWRVGADSARAAIRWGELPASYRNSTAGFRVVREVK